MPQPTDRHAKDRRAARWLIVADSLALPRPGVGYEHTWPRLLADARPQIDWISRGERGSTTDRLLSDGEGGGDCLEFYAPDGVILHLGICDCAPRLFARNSLTTRLIYRLPFGLNRRLSDWLEQHVGRRAAHAWVPAPRFESNLDAFLERASKVGAQVLALYILPVGSSMTAKNPLISQQIERYNAIYTRLAARHEHLSLVRVFDQDTPVEAFFIDGYHLNEAGGRRVSAALAAALPRQEAGSAG